MNASVLVEDLVKENGKGNNSKEAVELLLAKEEIESLTKEKNEIKKNSIEVESKMRNKIQ